jgi:oligopeptide transport system substrate-binding protein
MLVGGAMAAAFLEPNQPIKTRKRSAEDKGVLRVAYTSKLSPDPHRRLFPLPQYNQLMLSLWEPLVECDPATSQPRPACAKDWAWSADRLTLTLHLRPDAQWSNGDRVTAADFVRGWLRLLRQPMTEAAALFPLKNAVAFHQQNVTDPRSVGMRAISDDTLELALDQPRSTLVVELADPLLSPLHATSEAVIASGSYVATPAKLVTNGPFRLTEASEEGFMLEVNHYFHDAGGVRLAGIKLIRAENSVVAPLLLAAGVVDFLSPAPYGGSAKVPTDRPIRLEHELELSVCSLDFNVTRGPLRDVRVRQALALALDRTGAIEKLDPQRMVAARSWVPSMPGRAGLVLLKEDVAEARRLLAAAGFPGGRGFPILRMALPMWMDQDPFPLAWSEQWFQELGIKTYIAYEPREQRAARMRAGDFDVLCNLLTATVPDAGDLLGIFLWPPDFTGNKWVDQSAAKLLGEANTKTGSDRLAILEQAERNIMAAIPSVPVMFERRQTLLAAEVGGWYPDPLGRQSLKRFWLDLPAVREPTKAPLL